MSCTTNHQNANPTDAAAAAPQAEAQSCCGGSSCETKTAEGQAPVRAGRTFVPAVDTLEQGDELLLVADVPGAKADEIDIRYEQGELRIHAPIAQRNAGRNFLLQEYEVGHYARAFRIGTMFDPSRIEADFTDGVLTLRLPKHEATKPRKIAVKGSA